MVHISFQAFCHVRDGCVHGDQFCLLFTYLGSQHAVLEVWPVLVPPVIAMFIVVPPVVMMAS
jgi:hypothetical protein